MDNKVLKTEKAEITVNEAAMPVAAPVSEPTAKTTAQPAAKAVKPAKPAKPAKSAKPAKPAPMNKSVPVVSTIAKHLAVPVTAPVYLKVADPEVKSTDGKAKKGRSKEVEVPKVKKQKREKFTYELRIDLLGKAIKKARKERNLTQKELGQLVGVKKAQISKLENSLTDARFETIIKVFKALNVKINFNVELLDQTVTLS